MRSRRYKMVGQVLAFLLFCLSLSPLSGRAEAQMRCAGTSVSSAPCDHSEIPVTVLTETQVYAKMSMMPCCRSLHSGARRGFPVQHSVQQHSLSASAIQLTAAHRCLITVGVITSGTSTPPVIHSRWFLTANPALAPPAPVCFASVPVLSVFALSTQPSALSSYPSQHSHGLRAPPAA